VDQPLKTKATTASKTSRANIDYSPLIKTIDYENATLESWRYFIDTATK
jgi:hypothetical protein